MAARLCDYHQLKLLTKLDDVGLSGFVTTDPELVHLQTKDVLEREEVTPVNFDAVTFATLRLMDNAFSQCGPAIYEDNKNGEPRCCICFLKYAFPRGRYERWIGLSAQDAKILATELELVQ